MPSRTQIIATLGPSCANSATLREMIGNRMDIARINLAWGSRDEQTELIRAVREAARAEGARVAIICDLAGPRVQEGASHHVGNDATDAVTETDASNVKYFSTLDIEYFAQSFVSSASDVEKVRSLVRASGASARIIAKIERKAALDNAESIIGASDAIMIARGDLGNEVPLETIPFIELNLIKQCRAAQKPVIVATEMMPSMIEHETPTRSDITDVAFAAMARADAVMLSNETAIGKYPAKVIEMMERVLTETERRDSESKRHPL